MRGIYVRDGEFAQNTDSFFVSRVQKMWGSGPRSLFIGSRSLIVVGKGIVSSVIEVLI